MKREYIEITNKDIDELKKHCEEHLKRPYSPALLKEHEITLRLINFWESCANHNKYTLLIKEMIRIGATYLYECCYDPFGIPGKYIWFTYSGAEIMEDDGYGAVIVSALPYPEHLDVNLFLEELEELVRSV